MSFSDWLTNAIQLKGTSGFVCMSTVDDLSYTPTDEQRHRDAAQILATGRRSWKTLKGKGEAVWPPNLEAALIGGLEEYAPKAREKVGRFPMRNRFVSDFILKVTGKLRTPKQVGSRLQQLRDTCTGERILGLICRDADEVLLRKQRNCRGKSVSPPCAAPAALDPGASITPAQAPQTTEATPVASEPSTFVLEEHSTGPVPAPLVVYVDVLLKSSSWLTTPPAVHLDSEMEATYQSIRLCTVPPQSQLSHRPSGAGLHSVQSLDPTITFSSAFPLLSSTSFTAFASETGEPISSEMADFYEFQQPSAESPFWAYSVTLAPAFWEVILSTSHPSQYTIVQNVKPVLQQQPGDLARSMSLMSTQEATAPAPAFAFVYRFNCPEEEYLVLHQQQQQRQQHIPLVESYSIGAHEGQHYPLLPIDTFVADQQTWSEYSTSPVTPGSDGTECSSSDGHYSEPVSPISYSHSSPLTYNAQPQDYATGAPYQYIACPSEIHQPRAIAPKPEFYDYSCSYEFVNEFPESDVWDQGSPSCVYGNVPQRSHTFEHHLVQSHGVDPELHYSYVHSS